MISLKTGKNGADPRGVHSKIWEALFLIAPIYKEHGQILVITSLKDSKHSKKRSSHYRGEAADLRTRYFNALTQEIIKRKIQEVLGEDYVVVLEHNHIHIHWAPIYHEEIV